MESGYAASYMHAMKLLQRTINCALIQNVSTNNNQTQCTTQLWPYSANQKPHLLSYDKLTAERFKWSYNSVHDWTWQSHTRRGCSVIIQFLHLFYALVCKLCSTLTNHLFIFYYIQALRYSDRKVAKGNWQHHAAAVLVTNGQRQRESTHC